jgi:Sortase domain
MVALGSALMVLPAGDVLDADGSNRAGGPAAVVTDSVGGEVVRPDARQADGTPTGAEPVRVVIDDIGISAAVAAVALEPDGTLPPPSDPSTVGWHTGSRIPGDRGPAVMVGHVDSADGPAVFAGLDNLDVGDVIDIESGDGGIVSFEVSSVTRHPKHAFPTNAVYGPTPHPELHLITCGGSFDRETGYADNIVVTAAAVG